MVISNNIINEIIRRIRMLGVKDSEFDVLNTASRESFIPILDSNTNKIIPVESLLNTLLNEIGIISQEDIDNIFK